MHGLRETRHEHMHVAEIRELSFHVNAEIFLLVELPDVAQLFHSEDCSSVFTTHFYPPNRTAVQAEWERGHMLRKVGHCCRHAITGNHPFSQTCTGPHITLRTNFAGSLASPNSVSRTESSYIIWEPLSNVETWVPPQTF